LYEATALDGCGISAAVGIGSHVESRHGHGLEQQRTAHRGGQRGEKRMTSDSGRHWARTSALMWTMFALWVFFSFVIHFFVESLNNFVFLGFPLGFYMAAQGSLVVFVVMLFLFAKRQDTIDREEGVAEDQ
jgi:putative solute:sodium symporter small subunit